MVPSILFIQNNCASFKVPINSVMTVTRHAHIKMNLSTQSQAPEWEDKRINSIQPVHDSVDELPLALDTYSDTHDLWTNFSKHFLSVFDPMQAFVVIWQPWIAIINSHNHLPHVCEPPVTLHNIFWPFPTLLSLKFQLSSYSNILPASLQLSSQLLAWLCLLQSHDYLLSIAFVSQQTSEPF